MEQGEGNIIPSNPMEGGVVPASNVPTEPITASNTPSNAEQGGGQGAVQNDIEERFRKMQSIADQRQVENYRLQQQIQEIQTRLTSQPQQEQANPFDPQTHGPQWIAYETQKAADRASQKTAESFQKVLMDGLRQQQEMQWQAQHPDVDLNHVKAWAQMNGVSNLDHAYTLMTLPNQFNNVARNASAQTINSVRQPQGVANPVRGGQPAGGNPQYDFQQMLKQYNENPNVESQWPPEVAQAFHKRVIEWQNIYSQGGAP
jgi:hypothetical protein